MMLRTVWSEKLVVPDIGLAAQDATQPGRDAGAEPDGPEPEDAAAGTTAAAPTTSAAPPTMAVSRLELPVTDDSNVTVSSSSKVSAFSRDDRQRQSGIKKDPPKALYRRGPRVNWRDLVRRRRAIRNAKINIHAQ
jgi:hypothetical protein